jgi:hypothetical protein
MLLLSGARFGVFFFCTLYLQAHGDYAGRVLPAMIVIGVGLGMSFVPITIAATSGVAAEDAGLASGLLNTTQQGGGSTLPAALTHGFTGAFTVSAILCCFRGAVASRPTSMPRPSRWPPRAARARRTPATCCASPRGATARASWRRVSPALLRSRESP